MRIRKSWAACGLALGLFAGSAEAQITNFSTDVATAIDQGLDWFDAQDSGGQDAFDGWCPQGSHPGGDAVGLVTLAALEKRADADQNALTLGYQGSNALNQGRISRGIGFILDRPADAFYAYRDGADLMALSVYYRTGGPRRAEVLTKIRQLLDRTFLAQRASGYWPYLHAGPRDDSSTTQLVMAGLSAGRGALLLSIADGDAADPGDLVTDDDRLTTLNAAVLLTQQAYFNNGSAGLAVGDAGGLPDELGHGYQRIGRTNSRQQTASGLWGQLVTGGAVDINDAGVQGYLKWLQNRYRFSDHSTPWNGDNWTKSYYYYFWSFSKGMGYLEQQGIAPSAGNLGPMDMGTLAVDGPLNRQIQRDPNLVARPAVFGPELAGYYTDLNEPARWYFDLASTLLEQQNAAGRFHPNYEFWNSCSSQAYAILVLERSLGGGCIDSDDDGICDTDDNCVNTPNANQFDSNNNGVGDACEDEQICCMVCETAIMTSPGQCDLSGGVETGIEMCCPSICCEQADGTVGMIHTEECVPMGGVALPADQCGAEPDVCCVAADGTASTVTAAQCHVDGGVVAEEAMCEDVCCQMGEEIITLSQAACTQREGVVTEDALCEPVCCLTDPEDPQGTKIMGQAMCAQRGEALPLAQCEPICCLAEEIGPFLLSVAICERNELPVLEPALCDVEVCCFLSEDEHVIMPEGECNQVTAAHIDGGGAMPIEWCRAETVCCEIHDEFHDIAPSECIRRGGRASEDPNACEMVCCREHSGDFTSMNPNECVEQVGVVAEDPKSCEEACCALPDGTNETLTVGACAERRGELRDAAWCMEDICCELEDRSAQQLSQAACDARGGADLQDIALCEAVCCHLPDGTDDTVSRHTCRLNEGESDVLEACEAVCCTLPDGSVETKPANECEGEQIDIRLCTEVCCDLEDGTRDIMTTFECIDQGAQAPNLAWCEPDVCCEMADGSAQGMAAVACEEQGIAHPAEQCEAVCCQNPEDGRAETLPILACEQSGGGAIDEESCAIVCCEAPEGYATISQGQCDHVGGATADPIQCEAPALICCQIDNMEPALMDQGLCFENDGFETPVELCAQQPIDEGAQPLDDGTNGGANGSNEAGGCGCDVGRGNSDTPAWPLALLLLPVLRRRRQR